MFIAANNGQKMYKNNNKFLLTQKVRGDVVFVSKDCATYYREL